MTKCDNEVAWTPVGRTAELSTIDALTDQAAAGRPGLVIVRGTPGSGKSTLLDLVRTIGAVTVRHVRCAEAAAPFAAVRELLAPYEPMASPAARPVLLGDEPTTVFPVLHGLYRLVADLAADRPLVLLLDDAHLVDCSTARWLDFTLRRAADLPLLVVLAHPSGLSSAGGLLLTELSHHVDTTVLDLGPLGRGPVAELVARELSHGPDGAFLDACLEATGGNPMRLRELLARLVEANAEPSAEAVGLVRAFGGEQAAAATARWLCGQSCAVRRVAEAAALLGGTGAATLSTLCGLPAATVSNAVTLLVQNDVLTTDGVFRHAAVQDSVLAGIPTGDVDDLRVRAARLLNDEGRPVEEVAHQLMSMPELSEPWMFDTLHESAKAVTMAGAPEGAVRYLRRALEAAPGHVKTRIEFCTVLAMVDPSAALDQLISLLGDVTDAAVRASVAARCGIVASAAHRVQDALPVIRQVLTDLPDDVGPEARTIIETSLLVAGLADWETIRETVRWSRLLDVPTGDTPAQREMRQALAIAEVLSGGSARTAAELARTDVGRESERRDWWTLSAATVLHLAGESAHALDMADAVVRGSAGRGDAWHNHYALGVRGYISLGMGDLADAAADAESAIAIAHAAGWSKKASTAVTILASVLVRRDAADRAGALLASLGPPRRCTERSTRLLLRAKVLRGLGDAEGALDLVLRCGRELDETGLQDPIFAPWWLHAALLLAELGRPVEAVEPVLRGEALAARWDTAEARGLALLARGVITPGRTGLELLDGAVTELAGSPVRLAHIRALTCLGGAQAAAGDLKSARGRLRTAVDLAVRCGDLVSANEARCLLKRAGGRLPQSSTRRVDELTGGERRVAELAASGLSNKEIAEALFVTVRTVESHLSNTYRKLGVQVRADLVGELGRR